MRKASDGRQGDVIGVGQEGRAGRGRAGLGVVRDRLFAGEGGGAFHHVDGVGVELADDAGFGFAFAEGEHAESGDEKDRRAGVAHGGRGGLDMLLVVSGIFGAVVGEGGVNLLLQRGEIVTGFGGDKERTDLGANEVVGAAGAEMGERGGVFGIDEAEDFRQVAVAGDEALLLRDAAAEKREQIGGQIAAIVAALGDSAAEEGASLPLEMGVNELAQVVDHGDGVHVRLALGFAPGKESVSAEDDAVAAGVFAGSGAEHQAEFKAGPLPGNPDEPVAEFAVELLHLLFAVRGGGQGDGPVGMQMVDVAEGQEAVQGRVNGGGNGVQSEGAEGIEIDHGVFFSDAAVARLEGEKLVEIKRGEAAALDAAQVAAAALHPEDFSGLGR